MASTRTVHSSDSKSLWNYTLSPGWTKKETEVLRLAAMKYGIGNWKTITAERILPGKSLAQLVCQMQKLLGQQSLKEFQGIRLDPLRINARNAAKVGSKYLRKGGILINNGDNPIAEEMRCKLEANRAEFGLTEEESKAVVIPTLREMDTSNVVVDSTLKTTASVQQSNMHRLQRLEARQALLLRQLALLDAGEPPLPPTTGMDKTAAAAKAKRKPKPRAKAAGKGKAGKAAGKGKAGKGKAGKAAGKAKAKAKGGRKKAGATRAKKQRGGDDSDDAAALSWPRSTVNCGTTARTRKAKRRSPSVRFIDDSQEDEDAFLARLLQEEENRLAELASFARAPVRSSGKRSRVA